MSILTWGLKAGDEVIVYDSRLHKKNKETIKYDPYENGVGVLWIKFGHNKFALFSEGKQKWFCL